MHRSTRFVAALLLTAAAGLGCVSESEFNAMKYDRDSLQTRLNQLERSSLGERDAMRIQLQEHSTHAQNARSEVDSCRAQAAQLQQLQAEIRVKLEMAMPLLNYIVNSVQGLPSQPGYAPASEAASRPFQPRM